MYINYCITAEFNVFQNANCKHRKTISCYQVAVVTLFLAEKRKLEAKYSTRVFEIKSLTCSLMPSVGTKYTQKAISYLNLFTDFNLLSCFSRNRVFFVLATSAF